MPSVTTKLRVYLKLTLHPRWETNKQSILVCVTQRNIKTSVKISDILEVSLGFLLFHVKMESKGWPLMNVSILGYRVIYSHQK